MQAMQTVTLCVGVPMPCTHIRCDYTLFWLISPNVPVVCKAGGNRLSLIQIGLLKRLKAEFEKRLTAAVI